MSWKLYCCIRGIVKKECKICDLICNVRRDYPLPLKQNLIIFSLEEKHLAVPCALKFKYQSANTHRSTTEPKISDVK